MMKFIVAFLKRSWWLVLFLTVFWALYFTKCSPLANAESCSSRVGAPIGYTAPITTGYAQMAFTCTKDNLYGIRFYSIGADNGPGPHYRLLLLDEKNRVIASQEAASAGALSLTGDVLKESKGKEFTVRIEALDTAAVCPASLSLMNRTFRQERCSLSDGTVYEGTFRYSLLYTAPWYRSVEKALLLCVVILSYLSLLFLGRNLESSFLLLATLALFFILIVPFPNNCDEGIHFLKSTAISEGHPFAEKAPMDEAIERGAGMTIEASSQANANLVMGETEPADFDEFVGYFKPLTIKSVVTDYESWKRPFSRDTIFYANTLMSSYPPIGHTPAAIGISIGRLFRLPAFLVIWLGRLTSFGIYTILAWYSIRISKKYKGLIFCLCTMSSLMLFATAITADTLLNMAAILLLAICLHYREDGVERVKIRDILLMMLSVVTIASEKYMIYTPILLLFFLIPKECFGTRKKWWIVLGSALVLTFIAGGQQLILLKAFPYVEVRRENVDVGGQIHYVLAAKRKALSTLLGNYRESLGSYYLIRQLPITVTQTIPGAALLGILSTLLVAVSALFSGEPKMKVSVRAITAAAGILLSGVVSLLIIASLYVGYTAVGADYVDGVQPRYFFPVVTGFAFVLTRLAPQIRMEEHEGALYTVYAGAALLSLIAVIAAAFTVL